MIKLNIKIDGLSRSNSPALTPRNSNGLNNGLGSGYATPVNAKRYSKEQLNYLLNKKISDMQNNNVTNQSMNPMDKYNMVRSKSIR